MLAYIPGVPLVMCYICILFFPTMDRMLYISLHTCFIHGASYSASLYVTLRLSFTVLFFVGSAKRKTSSLFLKVVVLYRKPFGTIKTVFIPARVQDLLFFGELRKDTEHISLYRKSISCCNAVVMTCAVCVCIALFCDMVGIASLETVLVGVSKVLHDENRI